MPVTPSNPSETYVLVGSNMDEQEKVLNAQFSRRIDGQEIERVSFQISGAAFAAIFGVPAPDIVTPLAVVLATAIYNAAIAAGVITGTVTPDS